MHLKASWDCQLASNTHQPLRNTGLEPWNNLVIIVSQLLLVVNEPLSVSVSMFPVRFQRENTHLEGGWIHSEAWIEREKQAEHQHPQPSASGLWVKGQLLHTPATLFLRHDGRHLSMVPQNISFLPSRKITTIQSKTSIIWPYVTIPNSLRILWLDICGFENQK